MNESPRVRYIRRWASSAVPVPDPPPVQGACTGTVVCVGTRVPETGRGGRGGGVTAECVCCLLYLLNTKIRYRRARFVGGQGLKRRVYTVNILAGRLPDACPRVHGIAREKRGYRYGTGWLSSVAQVQIDAGTYPLKVGNGITGTVYHAILLVTVPTFTMHFSLSPLFVSCSCSCCRERAKCISQVR
jgi:hypothetical protein